MESTYVDIMIQSLNKKIQVLEEIKKEYSGTVRLGIETDTLDITGEVMKNSVVPSITKDELTGVLKIGIFLKGLMTMEFHVNMLLTDLCVRNL